MVYGRAGTTILKTGKKMTGEYKKKQNVEEEMSLLDLILILVRNRRKGLYIFVLLYTMAFAGFLFYNMFNHVTIRPEPSAYTENKINQGYIWDGQNKVYDNFSAQDIVDILLFKGSPIENCSNQPALKCIKTGDKINVLSGQKVLYSISIMVENQSKTLIFSSRKLVSEDKGNLADVILNNINDKIINFLIENVNEKITYYETVRTATIQNIKRLSLKKIKPSKM